jgi:hypothetical protein
MAVKNRYADNLKDWEMLQTSAAANAADLPLPPGALAKLDAALTELRALLAEQAVHKANKQTTSKRLRSALNRGRKVVTMMRGVIKEHYGIDNEKLAEFGIQPLRIRARRPAAEPEPQPEPTAPPQPPTTE